MTSILLIYPYFKPKIDRSVFRFPPLGVAYIAASLRQAGHSVQILDCTYLKKDEALHKALAFQAEVVGIYCMSSLENACFWFARSLRPHCQLLIAGGPLPTCEPLPFLSIFDVVVCGEGEQTILELIDAFASKSEWGNILGIAYKSPNLPSGESQSEIITTPQRPFIHDLDSLPFPARELLPNDEYIRQGKAKVSHSITTVMSTRGCPFHCDFCSNIVFGGSYRQRSPENVVDEIEIALSMGYDRIAFADDVFTLNRSQVLKICAEIQRRNLEFQWECLGRVDAIDQSLALIMCAAGCRRIYFGIESGSEAILKIMKKQITTAQARQAVESTHLAGLEVGAFFILFYPGDTSTTVLETLHFANSLPLDYMGLTFPYPLPGTPLFARAQGQVTRPQQQESLFGYHQLTFKADFSPLKMWFGLYKGQIQFKLKKNFASFAPWLVIGFEKITDRIFKCLA
jgi:anaerobic magnesium-protoporphyrin IX monomethyl ester cyclase